ncbi:SDR family oxidoreductase [Pseudotabrizicola algicola]|uniref:SDR family oxidoreductase n=1 Tax=Pseudotabrizicola algicola TaxID=2709381 RepID=A0A6B3RNP4_9RHOB|nr:SDR family oxidoreductase [Pseudotabrizicola algicola]NEX46488.1 SDR family oxidoreductase [Pseudotabrizicola algicola]
MSKDIPAQEQDHQPGTEAEMEPKPEFMPVYAGSGRLKDKVAVITGGDSGIGRAAAVLFAREGANVAILYKDEHGDADTTIDMIDAEGGEGMKIALDIGDKQAVEAAIQQVIDRFGRINILVNNAAEQHVQDNVEDISEDQLLRTFKTNIFGQFFAVQAVLGQMEQGDSIINITSVTAFRGQDQLVDYSSTKGAILAFTRALSSKLAERGIRVNAVAPGPIWTPLIPASFPADKVESFGQNVPLGRPGQPNEVAPCILFLACQDSSYITGQTLHPNGGELIGG